MNLPTLTQFLQCFTLADEAATRRLTARLTLVLRDPTAYQAQYAEELAERGIEEALPVQELRDVALLDALLSEDLAWESDWQDPAAEVAEGLNELLARQQRPERLVPAALPDRAGPEALDAVQEALEPLGLALVLFTLDSDSFPLGVVAEASTAAVRELAAALGFIVQVY